MLQTPEQLEIRLVPAELSGSIAVLGPAPIVRGQTIETFWTVSNNDFDTVFNSFEVSFWLSRDGLIRGDDRFLGSRVLPPGFPGFFTFQQNDLVTLPDSSDPLWDADSNFQLLVVVDPFNAVFEFNEFDNVSSTPISVSRGGGTGGTVHSLDELPETGLDSGDVLTSFSRQLQGFLKEAAKSQAELKSALNGAIPTVEKTLTALASDIRGLTNGLKPLLSGKAESVELSPGVTFTRADLNIVERYLFATFANSSPLLSARGSLSTGTVSRANGSVWEQIFPVPTKKFRELQQWYESTKKSINDTWEAVKAAPQKAVGYVAGLLGQSAQKAGEANLEGKAVTEDKTQAKERVAELMNGVGDRVGDASDRVANLMRDIKRSLSLISDDMLDDNQPQRNDSIKGQWEGTCERDELTGTIHIVFKSSVNKVFGTTKNTFFLNGQRDSITKGTFEGFINENGVIEGTITLRNKTGDSGEVPFRWFADENKLTGNLFEDVEVGRTVRFNAQKK